MSVELSEWIGLLKKEYLGGFIEGGGAAVKIAVAPPASTSVASQAIEATALESNCLIARVDAGQTRVHMIDQVFFEVARQVDWDALARQNLAALLVGNGIVCRAASLHDIEAIAEANGRQRRDLLNEVNRLIENAILRNYSLSREFRTAMAMLCWGVVNPQNVSPTDAEVIVRWLRGDKISLAGLKKVQIYGRIGRHNARLMLASLALWTRQSGHSGLVLMLDLQAVVQERRRDDITNGYTSLGYTRATLLDAYEVLRQFIDDTDQTAHLLVVALAGPGLLDDAKRSVDNYTALKMRIVDEVHDRTRDNPLNAMVRLAPIEDARGASTCRRRLTEPEA